MLTRDDFLIRDDVLFLNHDFADEINDAKREGKLMDVKRSIDVLTQVAAALDYAHDKASDEDFTKAKRNKGTSKDNRVHVPSDRLVDFNEADTYRIYYTESPDFVLSVEPVDASKNAG